MRSLAMLLLLVSAGYTGSVFSLEKVSCGVTPIGKSLNMPVIMEEEDTNQDGEKKPKGGKKPGGKNPEDDCE